METSIKRITLRLGKVILEAINTGKLQVDGTGFGELMAELLFAPKGQTKVIKTVNSVFSESSFINAVSVIIK